MRTHDSYHSVRDATMGHPTCARCKTIFKETWELQRHISRHSCPVFDAALQPAGAQCHDPDLQEAVRAGQLIELLLNPQHPEARLRFTLSCCVCGLEQSRVADLTRHLQTQHGPFYRAADKYVALIEEQHLDCVCNPRRPAQPRAHRCIAWRQLAMIEVFINPDRRPFFPTWPNTDDSLVKLAQVNPRLHAQAPKLIQDLRDNLPILLLEDDATCQGLGHHCALCNRSYQDQRELVQHIEQQRATECQQCTALLQCLWLTPGTRFLVVHGRKTALPTMWLITHHGMHFVTNVVLLNLALIYLQTRPDFESHGRAQTGGVRRGQDVPDAGSVQGMLAGAPTPSRQPASAKKIKVHHPDQSTRRSSTTAAPEDSAQSGQVSQLCRMLAILTLRHEDARNALACQDQCILFLTQGAQGVTHLLI